MASLQVLGVSGSMRERAHSARALAVVLESATAHGAAADLLDLRTTSLPLYTPASGDADSALPELRQTRERVHRADVILLATPDYHGSMSGVLKNFLDYHWHELAGKLFGYVCASSEKGLTAMDHLRTVVRQCYGWSLPYGAAVDGSADFGAGGEITNPKLARRLRMMGRDAVAYGTLIREQFARDLASDEPDTFAAQYRRRKTPGA